MANFIPQVKRVGKNDQEQLKLAFGLAKEKRFDEALAGFEAILQNDPASKPAHLGAGNMLFRQERYDEALRHFKAVMKLDPLMPQGPLAAGKVHLKQGNLEQALEAFQTTLNIDPTSTKGYIGLGQVFAKQEKYDEAIQQWLQALRLDPQLIPVHLLLAQAYQNQGKLSEAISALKAARNKDPKKWRIHQGLGLVYLQQNEYSDARESLQEAINLNPEIPPVARLGLTKALIEDNYLEEATEMLRQIPRIKQLAASTHKLWGDIYERQGLLKEAAEEYQAASRLASEEGDRLDEMTDLDAILEQDEDRWEEVVAFSRTVANRRVAEAQNRQRASFRNGRFGR